MIIWLLMWPFDKAFGRYRCYRAVRHAMNYTMIALPFAFIAIVLFVSAYCA